MSFRIQSFKQAAFWSTAIHAGSQALALIFSMVMAAVFGAQESTDILYYGLGLFMLATQLVQAVNVGVLVPEAMRRRHQLGDADAMAFINRFFAVFGGLIVLLTLLILWSPVRSLALISRFSEEALARNAALIFWLLLSFPLQMLAQMLLDVLVSYRYLTLPATLACFNRIIALAFVLGFHRQYGVVAVAMGMSLGFGLQIAVNVGLLVLALQWRPSIWKTRVQASVFRHIAWVELGTLVSALAGYLPLFLFSGFSAGTMTALNYARRMSDMPMDLLTSQVSSVAAIKFNEQAAHRDFAGAGASFGRLQRLLVLFLTPVAFLLALTGQPLISILFERGAFDAAAVRETARLFSVLVLGLPLVAIDSVTARLFIARQEVPFGTRCQMCASLLNLALVFGLVKGMGPLGFPVGLLLARGLYLLMLALVFPARLAPALLWPTVRRLAWTAGACGIAALAAWWGAEWAMPAGAGPWWSAGLRSGLFALAYGAVLWGIPPDRQGRDEGLELVRAASRRLPGRGRGARHTEGGSCP